MRLLLVIALCACVTRETRIVVVRSLCESERPAVACAHDLELMFDGCRWTCSLPAVKQDAMSLTLFGADIEALQMTNLCATPNYCEGR